MNKMATAVCIVAVLAISTVSASNVPVLMWSPERPLSDLPQAPIADSVSQDSFHTNYLKPLLGKQPQVLVAFLQDKLHVNDISKYADVYDQYSDGGAFKNIKGLLDENFSLELPRVLGSHLAVEALRKDFLGTVHELTSTSDLDALDLNGSGNYLVIVRLMPVVGAKNEEAAIASNDELVGKVSKHLQKRGVKYTALYTAETSEQEPKSESHLARRLLTVVPSKDGVFHNVSYAEGTVLAYLKALSVCIIENPKSGEEQKDYCVYNFTVTPEGLAQAKLSADWDKDNMTVSVKLEVPNVTVNSSKGGTVDYNITLVMPFKYELDRWVILEAELSVTSKPMTTKDVMVLRGYDPVMSLLYSFHCTSMEWYPKNLTKSPRAYIVLGGFQIQPFNTTGSAFALSQDCVGWFSTAIWMGIIPVGINLAILFFGMYMVSSLSTNDRFDDPKGKQLTVNAGE